MAKELFIGLMSGTSLDGVDVALVEFPAARSCSIVGTCFVAYEAELRTELLKLHYSGDNELEAAALMANRLAQLYARAVKELLANIYTRPTDVRAIGCHGQTIRHRPELGFTLQIGNAALLAELSGIDVIADFRSRDVAAGGQGAPLVPAFHQAVFADARQHRVIVNIGGIAILSSLPVDGLVSGFDSGPGNMLMDAWTQRHLGKAYDESDHWAETGNVIDELLAQLLAHVFFQMAPPKSTGRELFNLQWLEQFLKPDHKAVDVQRTLLELTVQSIATAITAYCPTASEAYICGGGARNQVLMQRLQQCLPTVRIGLTDDLGVPADWVEAVAFAWLARQAMHRQPGNLPAVTGATGLRILGAIYPH